MFGSEIHYTDCLQQKTNTQASESFLESSAYASGKILQKAQKRQVFMYWSNMGW
jgi:hypothetical protein